jgi:hypothetical protein
MANEKHDQGRPEHDKFVIHIDHKKYEVHEAYMTGADIRLVAAPPIGADYDLYLETPGPGDDEKIGDTDRLPMKNGMSFYSVLRQINPGASHAAS